MLDEKLEIKVDEIEINGVKFNKHEFEDFDILAMNYMLLIRNKEIYDVMV